MSVKILITEDDDVQRDVIGDILTTSGYQVTLCASAEDALEVINSENFDVLLTDMRMPGMDGLALFKTALTKQSELEVVVMTAHGTIKTAVEAMKAGAVDYLEKPFDKDRLLIVIDKAAQRRSLVKQNRQLRQLITDAVERPNIIGNSSMMNAMFDRADRAIQVNSTVLIQGESGTGKELIARHIHFKGLRKNNPFVVVNCAAIPENLVESELFGHVKGSFTGADSNREGKFEAADSGTIFLDEIGDLQLESQAKLLRVLQDSIVTRVGSAATRKVDVRIIAATNRDLKRCVEKGDFREDLYFRLEVLPIELPSLRERADDIPALVDFFREKLSLKLGIATPELAPEVIDILKRYQWPGNVRELENTLEQMFILSGKSITKNDLPAKLSVPVSMHEEFELPPGGIILEDIEQDLIRQALDRSHGSIKDAASLLGLTYKTLQYRLKKHNIDRINPSEE